MRIFKRGTVYCLGNGGHFNSHVDDVQWRRRNGAAADTDVVVHAIVVVEERPAVGRVCQHKVNHPGILRHLLETSDVSFVGEASLCGGCSPCDLTFPSFLYASRV